MKTKSTNKAKRIISVYRIINEQNNNRTYIGKTVNLAHRKSKHMSELKLGYHANKLLTQDYSKGYTFRFEIIETFENITKELLDKIETSYITLTQPYYNIKKK